METIKPLILAIDTATPATGLALTRGTLADGEVIASLGLSSNVTHSRRLLTSIDWLMEEVGIGWSDIDGIGVSLGPGSFTGLRIGMATAKGLAAAAGTKLLGISTLDSLAAKCVTDQLICSVLDARKKEVYAAMYKRDETGSLLKTREICAISPEDLVTQITEPVMMIGDGAVVYEEVFLEGLGDKLTMVPSVLHEPAAASLGLLCAGDLLDDKCLDVGSAVPLYVRSSDAELNLKKKQQALAANKSA